MTEFVCSPSELPANRRNASRGIARSVLEAMLSPVPSLYYSTGRGGRDIVGHRGSNGEELARAGAILASYGVRYREHRHCGRLSGLEISA